MHKLIKHGLFYLDDTAMSRPIICLCLGTYTIWYVTLHSIMKFAIYIQMSCMNYNYGKTTLSDVSWTCKKEITISWNDYAVRYFLQLFKTNS